MNKKKSKRAKLPVIILPRTTLGIMLGFIGDIISNDITRPTKPKTSSDECKHERTWPIKVHIGTIQWGEGITCRDCDKECVTSLRSPWVSEWRISVPVIDEHHEPLSPHPLADARKSVN